jgi:hypothetical protein
VAEERFGLGAKEESATDLGQEERPDAEAVPGEKELLLSPIPDRKGEGTVESVEAIGPPLFIAVKQYFSITAGEESMSETFELGAKLGSVVDLPVLNHPEPTILVGNGLISTLDVDDR